jgi:uncharacterized protein YciI
MKIIVAGPMLDTGDVRGIFIYNTANIEEAKAWAESDTTIITGTLIYELHPWYSSAALTQNNELHKKLQKSDIFKE